MSARAAETARAERARRLELVEKKKKKREARWHPPILLILSALLIVGVIFGVLLARVELVQSSFELQKIQKSLAAAEERHEELLLEAAKMESPARIEREARAMGMIEPPIVKYVVARIPTRKSGPTFARAGKARLGENALAVQGVAGATP